LFQVHLTQKQRPHRSASVKDLAKIRNHLEHSIADCMSEAAHRLRKKIGQARTPQELWLLRNDAYQLISQQHNQSIAADRINQLIQFFEGWLEPKQLVRIK
jgi:predicted GNAT family acetyltransferase